MAVTAYDIAVDRLLPFIIGSITDTEDWIYPKICPMIKGGSVDGKYYTLGDEVLEVPDSYYRAENIAAEIIQASMSSTDYNVQEKALAIEVSDKIIEQLKLFNAIRMHSGIVVEVMNRVKEIIAASFFFSSSYMTNYETGGASGGGGDFTYWSDTTNGDPKKDIMTAKDSVSLAGGKEVTHAFCGVKAYRDILLHPSTVDYFKRKDIKMPTVKQVGEYLGIPNIVRCGTRYKTAAGVKTLIWNTRNVLLAAVGPVSQYKVNRAIGGRIELPLPNGGKLLDIRPDNNKHNVKIEIRNLEIPIVIDADCGYLFVNAVAA